jgi:hypothetical protein
MKINLKKITLFLRIFGTISLIVFLFVQIVQSNNLIKNYFLYLSVSCFLIILLSKVFTYLGKHYYTA